MWNDLCGRTVGRHRHVNSKNERISHLTRIYCQIDTVDTRDCEAEQQFATKTALFAEKTPPAEGLRVRKICRVYIPQICFFFRPTTAPRKKELGCTKQMLRPTKIVLLCAAAALGNSLRKHIRIPCIPLIRGNRRYNCAV